MPATIDLNSVLKDAFNVLTEKEREIIAKRFALEGNNKHTLEEIGQKFSITRERVRQIEKIALGKLNRTSGNTKIHEVNTIAKEIMLKNGGVMEESMIVSEILNSIGADGKLDGNVIRLSLAIDPEFTAVRNGDAYKAGWLLASVKFENVKKVIAQVISQLKKKKDVLPTARLVNDTIAHFAKKGLNVAPTMVASSLHFSKDLKCTDHGWGLMSWRHINPKSIRDKALIVLRNEKKPLHFVEISNLIQDYDFDKKNTTVQAVHNELIRYEEFVLVGRGLYALREWGYADGTVADVIEDLLKKAKGPLSKKEIVDGVMAVRDVKVETISLNLQKNAHFVRVGRAVYKLDSSKK